MIVIREKRKTVKEKQSQKLCRNFNSKHGTCDSGCYEEKVLIGSKCYYKGLGENACRCFRLLERGVNK